MVSQFGAEVVYLVATPQSEAAGLESRSELSRKTHDANHSTLAAFAPL